MNKFLFFLCTFNCPEFPGLICFEFPSFYLYVFLFHIGVLLSNFIVLFLMCSENKGILILIVANTQ